MIKADGTLRLGHHGLVMVVLNHEPDPLRSYCLSRLIVSQ